MTLTRAEIAKAIKCEGWRRFRQDIKGAPTEIKLERLYQYLSPRTWKLKADRFVGRNEDGMLCCDMSTRCVQAINYLNALARGGLIEPVHKSWQQKQYIERYLREKRYTVKN